LTKIIGAEVDKLVYAGKGESPQLEKAGLVERFTEILRERDERIAELEREVVRLGGSVTKRRADPAHVDEYEQHLNRVAMNDPDPVRRLAAVGLLDSERSLA
jgi:hypothetical protein